ncbi:hypothetical protein Y695_03950 [Hydrogenophaga sp. T4]|nr:hypothetical protein Y695_03950 [Hydrogenophaga sp. T4]
MPLHAEHITRPGVPDGLDDAVLRAEGFHRQPLAQTVHALVVDAGDTVGRAVAIQPLQRGPGFEMHVVHQPVVARGVLVVDGPGALRGDVLHQAATEIDVDELGPAADAEHRLARLDEAAQEVELVAVANRIAGPGRVTQRVAVGFRTDVDTALQDQAIEQVDEFGHGCAVGRQGAVLVDEGDHQRDRPVGHDPVRHGAFQELQPLLRQTQTGWRIVQQACADTDAECHRRGPVPFFLWRCEPADRSGRSVA